MKIFLPFALLSLISLISSAQSLIIKDADGHDVTNSEIECNVHPSLDTESQSFQVINTSNLGISVNSVRYENECSLGSGEFYCWSICLAAKECGTEYVRGMPFPQYINPNSTSPVPLLTDFQPSFDSEEDGLVGTSSYTYVLYNDNNRSDSAYITLNYNISYAVGINEISENAISNVYPNPAQSQIQFDLNTNIDMAQFEIYSLVGQQVKQVNIENAQGKISIDIDDLVPGVYFLSEKNSSVTRRFIVSR
jgi:hypothetical protein